MRSLSSSSKPPRISDEGVILHEASPNRVGSMELVWGAVTWHSGVALAKFFTWIDSKSIQQNSSLPAVSARSRSVLELGAGTGIVGITMARLGAKQVALSDFEPEVWELLQQNIVANNVKGVAKVHLCDWRDKSTYFDDTFDIVVAADVLYSTRERMFARALAAHVTSSNVAYVASPFRKDSDLMVFFQEASRLGLTFERLEDSAGAAVGVHTGEPLAAYDGCRFVPLHDHTTSIEEDDKSRTFGAAASAKGGFSLSNKMSVQIFRVTRLST